MTSSSQSGFLATKGDTHLLPEIAHEVPAILLLTVRGQTIAIGNINEDLANPPNVLVRLGTKVHDSHPSCIGFRVFLRTDSPKPNDNGSIEENYHPISCRFDPQGGTLTHSRASSKDKEELDRSRSTPTLFATDLKASNEHELYRMDIVSEDTNCFVISRHGPKLVTTDGQVKKIEKMLAFIAYASSVSVFFHADKLLIKHLSKTVQQDCIGAVAPSWKTALPDSMLMQWPFNSQTQMVSGSTDFLNVLYNPAREQPLKDGPGTSVRDRPEAIKFRNFVCKTYPAIRREPDSKIFPVLLNVCDHGLCIELPFGASMLNRMNTYTAVNTLHGLLAAEIAPRNIGIVTLYPTQVEAYRDALGRCHKHAPASGYDQVRVDLLEDWTHETIGVTIVDIVRTRNASGNLGYLSQTNRLKMILSLHCNGLIVVGDRTCTISAHGSITSVKLDKTLQWFVDHGRIVQISDKGLPVETAPGLPTEVSTASPPSPLTVSDTKEQGLSDNPNVRPQIPPVPPQGQRRYVGIPGLEHLRSKNPISANTSAPIRGLSKIKEPSAVGTAYEGVRPPPEKSSHVRGEAPTEDVAARKNTDSYTRFAQQSARPTAYETISGALPKTLSQTAKKEPHLTTETSKVQPHGFIKKSSPHTSKEVPLKPSNDSQVVDKAANPFDDRSIKSKTIELVTSPTRSDIKDVSGARAQHLSHRFKKEVEPSTMGKLSGDTKVKIHPPSATGNSGHPKDLPNPPSSNRTTVSKDLPTTKNVPKENVKPRTLAPHAAATTMPAGRSSEVIDKGPFPSQIASPAVIPEAQSRPRKIKTEADAPEQRSTIPTSESPVKQAKPVIPASQHPKAITSQLQTMKLPKKATEGPDSLKTAQSPSPLQLLPPASTGNNLRPLAANQDRPKPNPAHFSQKNASQDFGKQHQSKYRQMRARYLELDPAVPRDRQEEDHLFRRLGDALMDEDERGFNETYIELMGMAARLKTRVLKSTWSSE